MTLRFSSPVWSLAFKLAHDIQVAVQQTDGVEAVEVWGTGYNRGNEVMKVLKQSRNE